MPTVTRQDPYAKLAQDYAETASDALALALRSTHDGIKLDALALAVRTFRKAAENAERALNNV